MKNPLIYIFDELTSALDFKTESILNECLRKYWVNATKIIIAHKLSALKDADEIIVLENGMLSEKGTHKSLLPCNGIYLDLWSKQLTNLGLPQASLYSST